MEDIEDAGAQLVAVGTGGRRYARAFIADHDIDFPVLLDRDAAAAQAAEVVLRASSWQLLGASNPKGWLRATLAGERIGKPGPRWQQLGATFVIDPGDEVVYAHVDETAQGHAPLDEVLDAIGA